MQYRLDLVTRYHPHPTPDKVSNHAPANKEKYHSILGPQVGIVVFWSIFLICTLTSLASLAMNDTELVTPLLGDKWLV